MKRIFPLQRANFPSDCEIALPSKGEAEYRAVLFKVAKDMMTPERFEEMMNKTLVYEMVPYWSESTGLSVKVWIDEMQTNERGLRSKRIAFQLDKSDEQHPENVASMDFDGNVYPSDADLGEVTRKDLQQLRNFVRNNRYALERVCEMDTHLETTWEFLIKGGEKASKEKVEALNRKVDELIAAHQAIETSSARARQKGLRGGNGVLFMNVRLVSRQVHRELRQMVIDCNVKKMIYCIHNSLFANGECYDQRARYRRFDRDNGICSAASLFGTRREVSA